MWVTKYINKLKNFIISLQDIKILNISLIKILNQFILKIYKSVYKPENFKNNIIIKEREISYQIPISHLIRHYPIEIHKYHMYYLINYLDLSQYYYRVQIKVYGYTQEGDIKMLMIPNTLTLEKYKTEEFIIESYSKIVELTKRYLYIQLLMIEFTIHKIKRYEIIELLHKTT